MMFYLKSDFNILVLGLGSKRSLLNHFLLEHVYKNGFPCVAFNGYHNNTNMRTILQHLTEYMEKVYHKTKHQKRALVSIEKQFEIVKTEYDKKFDKGESGMEPLVVFIHSLDMGLLKG